MSRSGEKAFKQCDVKVVEFIRWDKPVDGGPIMPHDQVEGKRGYSANGFQAKLHCPRTEDDSRVRIETLRDLHDQEKAYGIVRRIAGEVLCEHCIYSAMDPVQVSEHRTALARAEADRLQAEKIRQEILEEFNKGLPALAADTMREIEG